MGSVVIDMSMSLDGYIAAPNDTPEQGLGEDGMRLHNWAFDDPSVFEQVHGDLVEETGAEIMGRRSYDNLVDVLLGGGRRLFDELPQRAGLEQTGLSQADGVTHLEYRIVR